MVFHGINVCDKGYFDPATGKRIFEYEWTDGRIEKFRKTGLNIIRLGITWEAVEPEKGKYNEEYLDAIEKILDKCAILCDNLNIPCHIFHWTDNKPTSGLEAAARRANVLGMYEAVGEIAGKRILLLDDILTTGATAGECARVLLTCGAKEVHCAAVAAARK